jgi:hypothetical protein
MFLAQHEKLHLHQRIAAAAVMLMVVFLVAFAPEQNVTRGFENKAAQAATLQTLAETNAQSFVVSEDAVAPAAQVAEYTVERVTPVFVVPNVTPDPGSAQAIAFDMVMARGWGQDQFNCLVALWSKESGWRVNAHNASSGAYGIPQALPGNKMASAGADWATNPATQITWGLNYIGGRYGSPCGAWDHSVQKGWY